MALQQPSPKRSVHWPGAASAGTRKTIWKVTLAPAGIEPGGPQLRQGQHRPCHQLRIRVQLATRYSAGFFFAAFFAGVLVLCFGVPTFDSSTLVRKPLSRALPRLLLMTQAMSGSDERSHLTKSGRAAAGLAAAATAQQQALARR